MEPLAVVTVKLPYNDVQQITELAREQNLTRGGKLNFSEAMRQVVALGLAAATSNQGGDHDASHR